ncbi:aromatic ring-hydroxylating dioxygenase subunit alpha [Blastomonas sp.]|uniref:aromatic ring-hydroxylating oxygenase subunit alpha n=1 Tax=Blastomonas sp. TaxID=1909299 RepID=UPI0035947C81
MAERDPTDSLTPDWAASRTLRAHEIRRKIVTHIAAKTTDMAEGPLPLHKSVYTGGARFAAEREHLFLRQPLVAGLTGDIPQPGDYLVFDAAGPSILVIRGKDGIVRAFRNMCTHRGAKLVEQSEPFTGKASRLTCPFHAWTFNNLGGLIGQPGKAGFAGCDIGARDLLPLPCTEHLGLIFVRASEGEAIDAAAHLGDFADELALLELHKAVPVKKGILHAQSNWKFSLDTYGEGYHFAALHASTIGQTHYNDIAVVDRFGLHHRINFPDNSLGNLVGLPEADWPETEYGGVHYLFPNTIIFFGSITPGVYFTQVFRLFPDGVGKTRCQFGVYAPFGVHSDDYRGICEMAYDATAEVVQAEDYRVASHGYANLLTAPEDFHVVLGANECAPQAVHRHIADAVGMPL